MHSTVFFRLFAVLAILSTLPAVGAGVPVNFTNPKSPEILQ
jgi:hypothetical protein